MRIAFVSDAAFPWHVGGVERTERAEAEALAKAHEVHFLSFRWKGMRKEFTDRGIRYHCSHYLTDREFYRHKRRSIREAVYFSLICWRLFSERFDVVQVNAFPFLHLPVVKLYCRLTGCRLIMDVAEVWDRKRWIEYLGGFLGAAVDSYTSWTLRGADLYIANPGEPYRGLVEKGVERRRIRVFTPIIDYGEISPIKATGQRRGLVVSMGRLIKEKRYDLWLKVMNRLSRISPKARGMIVGDGPERSSIARMIAELGLEGIVELHGYYKDKRDVLKLMKEASVFLNMSEREGLSVVTLESLALGTPVALPDYSPIPEMVKGMCVVDNERNLPGRLAEIIGSRDKGRFIRNRRSMERFYVSGIEGFYGSLFRELGLRSAALENKQKKKEGPEL